MWLGQLFLRRQFRSALELAERIVSRPPAPGPAAPPAGGAGAGATDGAAGTASEPAATAGADTVLVGPLSVALTGSHRPVDRAAAVLLQCAVELGQQKCSQKRDAAANAEAAGGVDRGGGKDKGGDEERRGAYAFAAYLEQHGPVPVPMAVLWLRYCIQSSHRGGGGGVGTRTAEAAAIEAAETALAGAAGTEGPAPWAAAGYAAPLVLELRAHLDGHVERCVRTGGAAGGSPGVDCRNSSSSGGSSSEGSTGALSTAPAWACAALREVREMRADLKRRARRAERADAAAVAAAAVAAVAEAAAKEAAKGRSWARG